VIGWLIGAGVAVLVLGGMFLAMEQVSSDVRRLNSSKGAGNTLAYNINKSQPPRLWPAWSVLAAHAAHHAMVVEVEALRVENAREIAREIVGPVRDKGYQEILIYIYKAGDHNAAARRIQWTPLNGYVESAFAPVR
jgi:hypothetical protein